MRLYLIRHGETDANLCGAHQGWVNNDINEKGVCQAQALSAVLARRHFDRIICSDLLRTRHTCRLLFGEDALVEYDERLREVNNTVLYGKTRDELYALWGEEYRQNCYRLEFSPYGGESQSSLLARATDFLRSVAEDTTSEHIAAVTHGGTIRALLAGAVGIPIWSPGQYIRNCSVTKLEYEPQRGWRLIYINNRKEI